MTKRITSEKRLVNAVFGKEMHADLWYVYHIYHPDEPNMFKDNKIKFFGVDVIQENLPHGTYKLVGLVASIIDVPLEILEDVINNQWSLFIDKHEINRGKFSELITDNYNIPNTDLWMKFQKNYHGQKFFPIHTGDVDVVFSTGQNLYFVLETNKPVKNLRMILFVEPIKNKGAKNEII